MAIAHNQIFYDTIFITMTREIHEGMTDEAAITNALHRNSGVAVHIDDAPADLNDPHVIQQLEEIEGL